MAKLDLETSGESGGYSDSFEIEESLSLDPLESSTGSDTKNNVVPQSRKTQNNGRTDSHKTVNRTQTKPKVTTSELTNSIRRGSQTNIAKHDNDDDTIDLGRTIRSPLNITVTKRGGVTSDVRSNHGKSGSKFKHIAQNVHTMQSVVNTVRSFNDSLEVRDTVFGEWLARKTSQVSEEKSSKVQAKKLEDEKKRQKEVINNTMSIIIMTIMVHIHINYCVIHTLNAFKLLQCYPTAFNSKVMLTSLRSVADLGWFLGFHGTPLWAGSITTKY